jgi:hypothetical protein
MAGTWSTLTNAPPAQVATTFLLTDGTVLAQGMSTNHWYRLTPDASGSYAHGTWATMADSVHGPLYYASGILRDGRLIVVGGEYDFGSLLWIVNAEIYDPVANTWTTLPTPAGWVRIGDAPGCVLPDGRFMVGQVGRRDTAIYNPATNTWAAAAQKINAVGEESWSLLPDGTLHAVDCSNPPNAEKYIIASNQWVAAGTTPQVLVDSISEIGASVLLPDGRLFVIGATGFTAIYTPPPIANQPGTWASGPTIPQVNPGQPLGTVDAPACLLPNGKVLFSAGPITTPASFQTPTFFFEYDPISNTISNVPAASTAADDPYMGRMLMLPTGQVLYTAGSTVVELYTPDGAPDPVWVPTITNLPASLWRGHNSTLRGRQINGLSQCSYYGNDATQATNYPIVRLRSGSNVYYCRTSQFSTMGLQTGTIVHSCRVFVPSSVPTGSYCLEVVANGISSACRTVGVTTKWIKELKWEIKEKLEVIEHIKIRDIAEKRLPDIVDIKGIREIDVDFLERIQEEWQTTVRALAETADNTNLLLSRTFIRPEERPDLAGPPEPEIEEIEPRKISDEEWRERSDKRAFNDGRETVVSKEAEEIHRLVHSLSQSRGKGFDAGAIPDQRGRKRAAEVTKATKATKASKATKATKKRMPPPGRG